ncbi:MAG: hypothetical protein IPL36_03290 [Nigerium sp.]|nr:hypothetical protein [Nigerium sp.]MBK8462100.1 hypothetical protein [Nigerium sp.]
MNDEIRIRADERQRLARELHTVVAHRLSTASLRIMGTRGSRDPELLARTLATVDGATSKALTPTAPAGPGGSRRSDHRR